MKRAGRDRRQGRADPAERLQAIRRENSTETAMTRDARRTASSRPATPKKAARTRKAKR
jgi:hypothetical protein